ncbi:phage protein NinX family protein [Pseudomonas tohonis]|uniref:phage protein NinX family protein n=1 Tax=Pseudomonas tohonis TaxID=2725477 RepID=UPI001F18F469|nr:phage protein NinX family protein [Pseudomonas tohonis]
MKTVRTSELIGAALDWAVDMVLSGKPLEVRHHKSGNGEWAFFHEGIPYQQGPAPYSTDWSKGGPLLEPNHIELSIGDENYWANRTCTSRYDDEPRQYPGDSMLIAACRAIVAANLGDEVQIPAELLP